jgi:hypothetical protein
MKGPLSILSEYVILWALETLFGVTQDVDMVTTRAAVLEPEAIPTKLDVIIGNRYFQMIFEVEPYVPNIGLWNIWNIQNDGNEDPDNGVAKDTEMEAPNIGDTNISNANVGNIIKNNMTGKEDTVCETDGF